jgi:hypothetical protein
MKLLSRLLLNVKIFTLKNKLVLLLLGVTLSLFFLNRYNYNRYLTETQEVKRIQANLIATNDVLRIVSTRTRDIEYNKLTYLAKDLSDLKKLNQELYEEVKATKGAVKLIQKGSYKIVRDTIPLIVKTEVNDSSLSLTSKYDTSFSQGNYRYLSMKHTYDFKTKLGSGLILKDSIGFTATTGLKKTNLGYEIFFQPKYPGMSVTSLEGAIIDKNFFSQSSSKKKTPVLTLGMSFGWTPITYDWKTKVIDFNANRLGGMIGLDFNIIEVLKKK